MTDEVQLEDFLMMVEFIKLFVKNNGCLSSVKANFYADSERLLLLECKLLFIKLSDNFKVLFYSLCC